MNQSKGTREKRRGFAERQALSILYTPSVS